MGGMVDLVPVEDLVLLAVIMPHGVVEVIKALVHTQVQLVLWGAGSGGRIKFFASDCIGNIILPNTVSVNGGTGDSNADQGHFHMSTSLPCNVGSPPPPPPPPPPE